VQDKKRELGYKLKALQDQTQQDGKLRKFLNGLYADVTPLLKGGSLEEAGGSNVTAEQQNALENFFAPIEGLLDQITLNDFTLNGIEIQLFLNIQEQLQTKEKSLLSLQTTKDHLTKQINEQTEQIAKREIEKKNLTSDIASLETKIASIDVERIAKMKQEKVELYEQLLPLTKGELKGVQIPQFEPPLPLLQKEGVDNIYILIQTLKER
jgi:hypothetical protein